MYATVKARTHCPSNQSRTGAVAMPRSEDLKGQREAQMRHRMRRRELTHPHQAVLPRNVERVWSSVAASGGLDDDLRVVAR